MPQFQIWGLLGLQRNVLGRFCEAMSTPGLVLIPFFCHFFLCKFNFCPYLVQTGFLKLHIKSCRVKFSNGVLLLENKYHKYYKHRNWFVRLAINMPQNVFEMNTAKYIFFLLLKYIDRYEFHNRALVIRPAR
jgi:hypothetical protein